MASAGAVAILVKCSFLGTFVQGIRRTGRNERALEVQRDDLDLKPQSASGARDLVLMHVPYNFGHTVEKVALFPPSTSRSTAATWIHDELGGFGSNPADAMKHRQRLIDSISEAKKPDGLAWGHFSPELQEISNISGCALYFTPQKYWPEDVAKKYFGDKKVFGMLRNPYERLVAMVRGGLSGYGTDFNMKYVEQCDLNNAIKDLLKRYTNGADHFMSSCAFLPQAEYFDGPYGITVPVNNMEFPFSMNKVFEEHGYDWQVRTEDIFHVTGCPQNWSADLDAETKGLVKQVYARDFELLCQHFGKCDNELDECIYGVPVMCPDAACHGTPYERCVTEDPGWCAPNCV